MRRHKRRSLQQRSRDEASRLKKRPVRRKHLPEHFESIENLIEPEECVCADCGGQFKELGKPDESEVLEAKTVTFTVTRHIRPKKRCCSCARIVQAPAPSRPIEKSFAGASVLALILGWKYGFHLPLYRQCQIFAHAGTDDQPDDTHAVGGWHQHTVGTPGSSVGEVRPLGR